MEKISFLVVCLAVFISAGSALMCYECKSDTIEGCVKGAPGMNKTSCDRGLEHPQILQFCLYKTVYDRETEKETYLTSCESFRKPVGRDNNKDIPVPESIIVLDRNVQQCQPNVSHGVKNCEVCKEEFCNFFTNAAPVSKINFFAALGFPFLIFLRKFILS